MWSIWVRYDPSNLYYGKYEFELPDKWVPLYNFIRSIKDFPSIWTYHTFFHPLDHHYPSENKFRKDVSRSRFRRWESYKIAVAAHEHGEYKELTVRNLYSYWQIYSVYEILKAYTLSFFVDLTDKKTVEAFGNGKYPITKSDVLLFHSTINTNQVIFPDIIMISNPLPFMRNA